MKVLKDIVFLIFFFYTLSDHNHYVLHRSGIVEVSIGYYYVKESDLWQGDFSITIIIDTLGIDFIVRYLYHGQIKYDLYKTINYIRILFI